MRGTTRVVLAALVLAGVAACGTNDDEGAASGSQPQGASLRVTLGTQEFPEAQILGEMWRQALAVNGYTVDLRKGIGPAEDLDAALMDGEIDGYVAYTGTVLSIVAGEDVTGLGPEETYERAKEFYAGQDMVMSAMTPFENKDAIATTTAFAQSEQLETIADLGDLPDFTLAARPEFEGLYLGLEGLVDLYGLDNAQFEPTELGQQYAALDDGSAEAVNAFTTDPQLRGGDYAVLEDPELLFGSQNVVMVVGEDELERVGEETFLEVVDAVNSSLTQDRMVDLNAAVTEGQDAEGVAEGFLRENGLLTPIGEDE